MQGKVTRYFTDKRFGFIKVANQPDHFFHVDDFLNLTEVKVGMEVSFESEETEKGMRATLITVA